MDTTARRLARSLFANGLLLPVIVLSILAEADRNSYFSDFRGTAVAVVALTLVLIGYVWEASRVWRRSSAA